MVLIDALYINNSGGKVLLDYLMTQLELSDKKVFYLLDERIVGNSVAIKSTNRVLFLKAGLWRRHTFYQKHKNDFSTVLCFGNLPPSIKINAKVYTYFHQLLFLEIPKGTSILTTLTIHLKMKVVQFLLPNTDYWLVQTELVKSKFLKKYAPKPETVLLLPFYLPFEVNTTKIERKPNQYVFVSNGVPHKNHIRLVNAFCTFFEIHKKGTLYVTISEEFVFLKKYIDDKINSGFPIINLGHIDRFQLQELYLQSAFHIFPSLTESFGLGLIEGVECGCAIIGADLAYTYAVCEPSIVFNPLNESAIVRALEKSLTENLPPVKLKLKMRWKHSYNF
jgi:glycosyltransferase involved in cell wall biosynthesis